MKDEEIMIPGLFLRGGPRFTKVGKRLWVGGAPNKTDEELLIDNGIKHVLNVAREVHDDFGYYGNLASIHVPFQDGHPMPPAWVKVALTALKEMDEASGATLVHCGVGISRSPTTIALYWYAKGETGSFTEGIVRMQRVRQIVRPHSALVTPEVMEVVNRLKRKWAKKSRITA